MKNFSEISKKIDDYMEAERNNIATLLLQLAEIESVSGYEADIAEFLIDEMDNYGFDEAMIDPVGNVLGRVGNGKTIIFYDAHLDTSEPGANCAVPLESQREGDKLSGFGVTDCKASVAGMMFAAKAIKSLGLQDKFTLWVCNSLMDKACTGSALDALFNVLPDLRPHYILTGCPSGNKIIRGYKGKALLKISVPSKFMHASLVSEEDNVLMKAATIINEISQLTALPEDPFLGKGKITVTNLTCRTPSSDILPEAAVITCDFRLVSNETPDKLQEILKPALDSVPGAKMSVIEKELSTYTGYRINAPGICPPWVVPEDHQIIRAGKRAFELALGKEAHIDMGSFCMNTTFACGRDGVPGLGFGPGDPALSYTENEFVSLTELVDAAKFYAMFPVVLAEDEL